MRILALDSNHELLTAGLRENGFEVVEDFISPKEELLLSISEYDGLVIRSRIPVDKEFLQKAKNLKFIGRVGAGLENIDENFANSLGIKLFNAPEGNKDSLGEHAVGMLLMLMHRLKIADHEVRNGIWLREENRGDELMGKTVGIIGYGNMGKSFSQRLKGFGVNSICYDILSGVEDENAKQVDLDVLFEKTDILSLHTPQTPETLNLINDEFLSNFKKPIYFINTARGKSVVTKDLVAAMEKGKVIGACLDVNEYEKTSFENWDVNNIPEEFNYLLHSDRVILTPHIAGWTVQSKEKLAQVILDKIVDWKKSYNIA